MIREVFAQSKPGEAARAAEEWCANNGLSVGEPEPGRARALVRGRCTVGKWTTLSQVQKDRLDGHMRGDVDSGPITVEVWT